MHKLELGRYKHFKGGEYEVMGIAKHSETLEDFVIYKPLYNHKGLWIRPLSMFLETIIFDGKKVERFQKIKQKILIRPKLKKK
ncbi:DUF1653 domain-containing protein [Candidatus Nomurabacteria bacterium CG_4_10_14_0_2_um_filter_30_12]|uniref:DUF1653 domain-containing protein n=2 Tax=Candidatus Nomuraibacteriota TaxID=1752729 RepID=A0A1J4UZV5_9BACT|nr:MAG: hypothetical protein AUJ22_01815 [Candidatus Nomurabacteria bacterium CG1_02_31_12]PIZ86746.1 MAG: DUF1653 domain-containing protein [Candidatus Nomurabacteria bacterium CG_4_10_14_0_2_um_filter_30_12]